MHENLLTYFSELLDRYSKTTLDKKAEADLRQIFDARDRWRYAGQRTDLDAVGERLRKIEISVIVDEIIKIATKKDDFDLEAEVSLFLDEHGYVTTGQLVDEIIRRAGEQMEQERKILAAFRGE